MHQAVILAGGEGTRLRAVNPVLPKPMVDVGGVPFLKHLVEMLYGHGVREFVFLLGYHADYAVDFLKGWKLPGAEWIWSVEPSPLGTAGALKFAQAAIRDDFVLLNGDSYLELDYGAAWSRFVNLPGEAMLVVYDNACATDVPNNVALDAGGRVCVYSRDAGANRCSHVDAGVLFLRKKVLDRIPAGRKYAMEQDVYAELIREGQLYAWSSPCRFFDIGTPARLQVFLDFLREGEAPV